MAAAFGRYCCKKILPIRARKIDSRYCAYAQTLSPETVDLDSIVADSYFTELLRRLLQHNRPSSSVVTIVSEGPELGAKRTTFAQIEVFRS
jgi:hypothetical protein